MVSFYRRSREHLPSFWDDLSRPYGLEKFLPELLTDILYVFTDGQMPAAQAIALSQAFSGLAPMRELSGE
jgi:hypothetical protein